MNSEEIESLKKLFEEGNSFNFKDDYEEGNILYIEDDYFYFYDFVDEIEKERCLLDFEVDNFIQI